MNYKNIIKYYMASRISIELYKQAMQLTKPLFIPLEYRKHKKYKRGFKKAVQRLIKISTRCRKTRFKRKVK